jgi:hypothetical protein
MSERSIGRLKLKVKEMFNQEIENKYRKILANVKFVSEAESSTGTPSKEGSGRSLFTFINDLTTGNGEFSKIKREMMNKYFTTKEMKEKGDKKTEGFAGNPSPTISGDDKGETNKYYLTLGKEISGIYVSPRMSDYKKSDANFYDGEKDLGGVSLKKDNAIYWESADVRFKNEVKNLVDAIVSGKLGDEVSYIPLEDTKGNPDPDIIKMYNKKENKPIAGVIVNDLPAQETNEIIFGNDKVPVVVRTFRPSDFTLDGDTVIVNATKIYETIEDIKADNAQPVLNIRHDKTRRATRGLRALLQTAKSLYTDGSLKGNNITIPYNSFN